MFKERERTNWTQDLRRKNLLKTQDIMKKLGGYSKILDNMHDFQRYLAFQLGCSIKKAAEYIETVRGAQIFQASTLDSLSEKRE